jgi:hypothetical protein
MLPAEGHREVVIFKEKPPVMKELPNLHIPEVLKL